MNTYKITVMVSALAVGFAITAGWYLLAARSMTTIYITYAVMGLIATWVVATAPPHKRWVHGAGLLLGLAILIAAPYVMPHSLVSRVVLAVLAWYAVVEGYGLAVRRG